MSLSPDGDPPGRFGSDMIIPCNFRKKNLHYSQITPGKAGFFVDFRDPLAGIAPGIVKIRVSTLSCSTPGMSNIRHKNGIASLSFRWYNSFWSFFGGRLMLLIT